MTDDSQKMLALVLGAVGTVSGVVGCVLGIFNTWRQWDREKVKLVVTWKAEPWGGGLGKVVTEHSVRVENRSNFAVTIDDVGLVFGKSGAPKISFSQTVEKEGDTITNPLPIRLEARESVTLTNDGYEPDSILREFDLRHLFVRTACGVVQNVAHPMA